MHNWEYVHMNQSVVKLRNGREKITRNGFDRFFEFPASTAAASSVAAVAAQGGSDAPAIVAYADHTLATSLLGRSSRTHVATGVLDGKVCAVESACLPGAYHDQRYGGRASFPDIDNAIQRVKKRCRSPSRGAAAKRAYYCSVILDNDWRVLPDRVLFWETDPAIQHHPALSPRGAAWGRARTTLIGALCRAAESWETRGLRDGRAARAILFGQHPKKRGNALSVSIHARRGDRSLSIQTTMSRTSASTSGGELYGSAKDIRNLAVAIDERARQCGWDGAEFLVHTEATNAEDLADAMADMPNNVDISFNASITLDFARMLSADVFVAAAFSSLSTVLRALRHTRGSVVVGPADYAPQDTAGEEHVELPLRTARWAGDRLEYSPAMAAHHATTPCAYFPGLPPLQLPRSGQQDADEAATAAPERFGPYGNARPPICAR